MCEANVYLVDEDGNEVLVLDSVDKIVPSTNEIFLQNIYNERKILKAKIRQMELVEHRIVLELL